ncbi:MAG: T9SS type A sorting domain-containing protein, partial [Phaeodactylibacter sp.]|nr:T9SS type A sorting domain-containing protein [Phaeodactylibacter sp.]
VPDTLYACGGRPFSFCLPGEKYDWSRPGVTDGLGPCLSFQSPEPGINGHYTLTARLSDSCILSREVFLTYTQPEDCELALRPGQNTNSLLSAVYPNPARAQAWVSTGTATAELIEIFDQNGQTVLRIRPEGTVTRLSLPGIKAGMYFIRARYKGGAEVIRLAIY